MWVYRLSSRFVGEEEQEVFIVGFCWGDKFTVAESYESRVMARNAVNYLNGGRGL